jgi:hypothetical protein
LRLSPGNHWWHEVEEAGGEDQAEAASVVRPEEEAGAGGGDDLQSRSQQGAAEDRVAFIGLLSPFSCAPRPAQSSRSGSAGAAKMHRVRLARWKRISFCRCKKSCPRAQARPGPKASPGYQTRWAAAADPGTVLGNKRCRRGGGGRRNTVMVASRCRRAAVAEVSEGVGSGMR